MGFIDGEGCFSIALHRTYTNRSIFEGIATYQVCLRIIVNINQKDKDILEIMQREFGTGKIYTNKGKSKYNLTYIIGSMKGIHRFIDYVGEDKFIGKKQGDYQLLLEVMKMMENKEHFTEEGMKKIKQIRLNKHIYNRKGPKLQYI